MQAEVMEIITDGNDSAVDPKGLITWRISSRAEIQA